MLKSFLRNLLRAYPSLPYAALGFMLAWVFILNSGTGWLSDTEKNGENMTVLFVASTFVAGVLMVVASRLSGSAEKFFRPSFVLIAAGISSLSCLVIIVIGPYYLMKYLPYVVIRVLFFVSCATSGMGFAAIFLRCGALFGELPPRKAILYVALSHIIASLAYFVLVGAPVWAPVHGGPSLFGILMFVGLPLLSAFFCCLEDLAGGTDADAGAGAGAAAAAGSAGGMTRGAGGATHAAGGAVRATGGAADNAAEPAHKPYRSYFSASGARAFRKLIVVVFVLGVVIAVIRSVSVQVLSPVETFEGTRLIMLLRILIATVIACVAVCLDAERFNFERPYTAIMVATVMVIAALPVLGILHAVSGQIVMLVSSLFDFLMWCILSLIVHQKRVPAPGVFGPCYGLYLVGTALGWVFGSAVFAGLIGTTAEFIVYAVLVFGILGSAFFLFTEKEFAAIFAPKDESEETLEQMLAEDVYAKTVAVAVKPARFVGAIDALADEYGLTAREKDIFRELAMGHDASSISNNLTISWNTVRTHTRNVYAKMGIHTKQELIELVDDAKRKIE